MASQRIAVAINATLYQAGWFACVLGAAHASPWLGVLAAVPIIAWHLARSTEPRRELALIVAAACLGAVFETALLQSGLVSYEGAPRASVAPLWMVALWAMFATTLNVSLRSLRGHLVLGALLGAVGAPAAYYAGARLGAMQLATLGAALTAIAVGWALLTPLLLRAARQLDGYPQP